MNKSHLLPERDIETNLVSMADLMSLLLIFLFIAASFNSIKQFEVDLAEGESTHPLKDSGYQIVLKGNYVIYNNERYMDLDSLASAITFFKTDLPQNIQLTVDNQVTYGRFIEVFDFLTTHFDSLEVQLVVQDKRKQ